MDRQKLVRASSQKRVYCQESDDEEQRPVKSHRKVAETFQEDDDDDSDDENPLSHNHDNENNAKIEAGQIVRVYVENFMCHRKFTVDFNRHINFVNGQNGSGKSAIAAAIQLCLGASAKVTGRGTKLDGLIREGSNGPAIIRVTLLNEGSDAYLPDVYKNRIVIERTINKNGVGTYQIKNKDMEVVSREKRELENILRNFNIYVDNPCCVLTQEESKKFIHGRDDEKYDFFLKATGLKRTSEELHETADNIAFVKSEIGSHDERVRVKRAARDEQLATLSRLQDLDAIDAQVRLCRAKAYFDDHAVAKGVTASIQESVDEKQSDVDTAQARLTEAEDRATDKTPEIADLTAQLGEAQARHKEVSDQLGHKQRSVVAATKAQNALKSEIEQIARGKQAHIKQQQEARARLEEMRQRALQSAQKDEVMMMDRIQQCEQELSQRREREGELRQHRQTANDRVNEVLRRSQQLSSEMNGVNRSIDSMKKEIQEATGGGSQNKVRKFGFKAAEIVQRMQNTRFRGPVFGPIGICVQMKADKQEKWGRAVEKALFPVLKSFVVSCHEDRQTLGVIMKSCGAGSFHPIILQHAGGSGRYNIPDFGSSGILTVAECVSVGEDLVFNALVDQTSMDRAALVDDEDQCRRQLVERDANGLDTLVMRLNSVLTIRGTTIKYNRGNQSSEVNRSEYKALLSADSALLVQSLREQIQGKQEELVALQRAQSELKTEHSVAVDAVRQSERLLSENVAELRGWTKEREKAAQQLEEVQAAAHVDTSETEREIAELQAAVEDATHQISERETDVHSAALEVRARQAEKRAAEEEMVRLADQMAAVQLGLERLINDNETARRKLDSLRRILADKRSELNRGLEKLKAAAAAEEAAFKVAMGKAAELVDGWTGEPLVLGRKDSRRNMEQKEVELNQKLAVGKRQANVEGLTMAVVSDRVEKTTADYRQTKSGLDRLKQNLADLESDYAARSKLWSRSLKNAAKKTREMFDMYIQRKGYSGSIEFDHKAHTLKIQVQIDNMDKNTLSKEVRQLSGGERSFVTFSLLLALGHVIECPFRLMDEYDVFLDEFSRKITLDELTKYAFVFSQRNRQFIVITPHKLNDVHTKPGQVKIIRMEDPKRRSAHGLQQQTL